VITGPGMALRYIGLKSPLKEYEMNKSNSTETSNSTGPRGPQNDKETVSRRVAEELHERIDQAAERGDEFERKLHEHGAQVKDKTEELTGGLNRFAHDNPWMLVGGSVALGVLIGSVMSRR